MNYERFLIGLGLLLIAAAVYYWTKDDKPSCEENGFTGPTLSNFIGIRMCVITAIIVGVCYIIGSLPLEI